MHSCLYKAKTYSDSPEKSQMLQTLLNFDLPENVAGAQIRSSGPSGGAAAKDVGLFKAFNPPLS